MHPDAEMNAVGLGMAAGLAVLLVPTLPFVVTVWPTSTGIEAARGGD